MNAPSDAPSDIHRFIAGLARTQSDSVPSVDGFFDSDHPILIARAPGRLDVMGGIADYSGSLVLQLPTLEATIVAAQSTAEPIVRIHTMALDHRPCREFTISIPEIQDLARAGYDAARARLSSVDDDAWAAYVVGTLLVLGIERAVPLRTGLRLLIQSSVPEGKGVSSSAALEVATMQTVSRLLDVRLSPVELAALCQSCENHVVGAPCGIMDQMTSTLGRSHRLLALSCQPMRIEGFIAVPPEIGFWGIDSGVRHAISGSDYSAVRIGAAIGYRMIAECAGLPVAPVAPGVVRIDDDRWHGYLANIDPHQFDAEFLPALPERMRGRDFLARYGGIGDDATRIDPDREYPVRPATRHPVDENARVKRFAELLPRAEDDRARLEMGELMVASHESYSDCGLGSSATESLVRRIERAGVACGLYGARITGGGSGGTVAVLARSDAELAILDIARRHRDEFGCGGGVFSGSSPGAAEVGVVVHGPRAS